MPEDLVAMRTQEVLADLVRYATSQACITGEAAAASLRTLVSTPYLPLAVLEAVVAARRT